MLEQIPSNEELSVLIGSEKFKVWNELCGIIDNLYDMDHLWNSGGKAWKYEYKYRRGGKTLCALYAKENCFGFMVILGRDERAKFEADRQSYSIAVCQVYDKATTYHDGKWLMFELRDTSLLNDMKKLLAIKRRPNKK